MDRVLDIAFVITILSSVLSLEANYQPPIEVSRTSRIPTSKESSSDEPKITEECRNRGYCVADEVDKYPEELVKSLTFKKDGIKNITDDGLDPTQRDGDPTNLQKKNIELCESEQDPGVAPRSLPDSTGKHFFVANVPGVIEQKFNMENCKFSKSDHSSRSCSSEFLVNDGYRSVCKQIYVYRQVYVIIKDQLEKRDMRLNGCCSCVIHKQI